MPKIERSIYDIDAFETLSQQNSPIHHLDARIKLVVSISYIIIILSIDKYSPSLFIPYFLFPFILLNIGNIPLKLLLEKVVLLSPFAIIVGIFNPFLDKTPIYQIGPVIINGGMVSFTSILIRFVLTVSISFILLAVTGFYPICNALNKMGIPSIFTVQLMLMYRYIFLLIDEAIRLINAHHLRSFKKNKIHIKNFTYLMSHLLIRTIDRSQNIYYSMLAKGFDGKLRMITNQHLNMHDFVFLIFWCSYFIFFRFFHFSDWIGKTILGANG